MTWGPLDLLPGLYVLLLAAGLAAALRRWFDPVPWRVLAAFLLLIAVLLGPALFAGWTLLPVANLLAAPPFSGQPRMPTGNWMQGDVIFQIAPWVLEVRQAVSAGGWPLWNGDAGIGMPLMGDPQTQFLQPLVFLAWPFPVEPAMGIIAALRLLTALVFTFLFLKRQGLGDLASAAGGLAYALGGFVMLWLGWPIGNVAALLPAVLYGVARCDEPGRRRDHVLLFGALTSLLLGGHPETMMYGLVLAGLLLLSRVLARQDRGERRRLLLSGGATFLLAGCCASPVLLLAQEYLPGTHRARIVEARRTVHPVDDLRRELARPGALEAWGQRSARRLLPVAAAHAFGELGDFWGDHNVIEDQCGFAGAVPLLAAGTALLPFGRRRRFPHERFFALALAVSVALIAQPPGFDRLFLRLPVIGMTAVHLHHRLLLVITFCVAVLAAAEIERWSHGELRRPAVALAAVLLAALLLWAYLGHPSPEGRIITGFLSGGLTAQLLFLLLATALLCLRAGEGRGAVEPEQATGSDAGAHTKERRRARWLPAPSGGVLATSFALLLAAELLLVHRYANPPIPTRTAYPLTPPIRFLQENLGPWRMVALGNCFLANLPLVYGLRDARIDNPSQPAIQALLTSPVSRSPLSPRFGKPNHPVYDLLGVRWVMTRADLKLPLRLAFRHPEAWVWERPRPLPPVFLPRQARVHRGEDWRAWVHRNTDFGVRALVQASPGHRKHWRSRAAVPSRLDLVAWEGARLRARADLGEPRLLASSILQDGHWHLLVDGRRTPTVLTNGPLVGAWLPAGRHDIELLYRPRRFFLGCVLAALALAAACALWIPPPVARRPRCYAGER